MKLKRADGGEFEVEILERVGDSVRATIGGREVSASIQSGADGAAVIVFGGARHRVFGAKIRDRILVAAGPASFEFKQVEEGRGRGHHGLSAHEITAPMPGKVARILVKEGQKVAAGDAVAVMEAMKMEIPLLTETDAMIKEVLVTEGQMVDHGAVIVELAPAAPSPS